MASCAARLGSIHCGRVRGHSGARIRAPRAQRCSPLLTSVVCAPRVIAVGCCCCSGARIDERARPDAAACCSIPAGITRNAWDHRALRQIDALLRFRRAVVAPRWLRSGYATSSLVTACSVSCVASSGHQITSCLRRAGTGRSGPMPSGYGVPRTRGTGLGGVLQWSYSARTFKREKPRSAGLQLLPNPSAQHALLARHATDTARAASPVRSATVER